MLIVGLVAALALMAQPASAWEVCVVSEGNPTIGPYCVPIP
jgi:hypothetical protein